MHTGFSRYCVSLEAACSHLTTDPAVRAVLSRVVGDACLPVALDLMKSGSLTGDLGEAVHDFFLERIQTDAIPVWTGFIYQSGDRYPVRVNGYHGVFWVWAVDEEPIGYFLDQDRAVTFARTNWDDVYEEGADPEADGSEESPCPYCEATDSCEHLLLVVDRTFREAQGGLLCEAFNSKWADLLNDTDDPDFDESTAFDEILEEVDALSDMALRSSPNSAPGLTSSYSIYFSSSKRKAAVALKKFSSSS
jgi:hypothetical protein